MIEGTLLTELGLAVGAGVATFFSPCAYALLPGYIGVYLGVADRERRSLHHDAVRGVAAAAGVALVVGVTIVGIAVVGERVQPLIGRVEPLTGGGLVVFGLLLFRDSAVGWHVPLPKQRRGLAGFGLFGAIYAVAAVGCVAPLFFGLVLTTLQSGLRRTVVVLSAYGGTIALLLLGTTFAIGLGYELAELKLARLSIVGQRLGGGVLVLAGVFQLALTL